MHVSYWIMIVYIYLITDPTNHYDTMILHSDSFKFSSQDAKRKNVITTGSCYALREYFKHHVKKEWFADESHQSLTYAQSKGVYLSAIFNDLKYQHYKIKSRNDPECLKIDPSLDKVVNTLHNISSLIYYHISCNIHRSFLNCFQVHVHWRLWKMYRDFILVS